MAEPVNQFYECDNPGCRLRFPGSEILPKWHRCPACRSSIHLASTSIRNHENYSENRYEEKEIVRIEAILDNIRSAGNVGSIFRTADGTGIKKVYICGITPSPENSKVSKTGLGAEIIVSWEKHNNGVLLVRQLKAMGYHLWALENLPGAHPLFQIETGLHGPPIALIIGNEISGIDPGILELCDVIISIPMLGKKQSYNVAVAFGIAASFLLYRQSVSHESLKILPST